MNSPNRALYAYLYQSPATNQLSYFSQQLIKKFLDNNQGDVELPIGWKKDKDIVYWVVPRKVKLNGRTQQIFDYIVMQFTSKVPAKASKEVIDANKELTLDLREISNLFKITMRNTRNMVIASIRSLQNIKIRQLNIAIKEKKEKPLDATVWESVILQGVGCSVTENLISNSKTKVLLGDKLAEYLPTASIMPLCLSLFSINTSKYPNAYAIGRHLNILFKMNYYKPRRNTVTVKELLEVAPSIPKYETLIQEGNVYQRIIAPFIRDMNILVNNNVLKEWYLIDNVTNEKYEEQRSKISYHKFKLMKVFFDFQDFPMKELNHVKWDEPLDNKNSIVNSSGKSFKITYLK